MLFFSVSCEHEVSLLTLTQFPLFFCKEEEDFNITTFQPFSIENKNKSDYHVHIYWPSNTTVQFNVMNWNGYDTFKWGINNMDFIVVNTYTVKVYKHMHATSNNYDLCKVQRKWIIFISKSMKTELLEKSHFVRLKMSDWCKKLISIIPYISRCEVTA